MRTTHYNTELPELCAHDSYADCRFTLSTHCPLSLQSVFHRPILSVFGGSTTEDPVYSALGESRRQYGRERNQKGREKRERAERSGRPATTNSTSIRVAGNYRCRDETSGRSSLAPAGSARCCRTRPKSRKTFGHPDCKLSSRSR